MWRWPFPTIRPQATIRSAHLDAACITPNCRALSGWSLDAALEFEECVHGPAAGCRPATLLDGDLDGKKLHMETTDVDRTRFLLVNRGFNWIQEVPFNR